MPLCCIQYKKDLKTYSLYSSCHHNLKLGNFKLLFFRGLHEIVQKCLPHVQHAYLFLLDESNS